MAVSCKDYMKALEESIAKCNEYIRDPKIKKLYVKHNYEAVDFVRRANNFIQESTKILNNLKDHLDSSDYSFQIKNIKEYMEQTEIYYNHIITSN